MASSLGDRTRVAGLVVTHGARAAGRRVIGLASASLHMPARTPEKLLIAPQDLRTTDPTRAGEIYAGTFAFAGKAVDLAGRSPFVVPAPSTAWAEGLHGFGWLRHLRAADTTLSRENGRALVDEWITLRGGPDRVGQAPHVLARRLISWFCHAPLILEGSDRAFYRRFLKSINRQTGQLSRLQREARMGLERLTALIALTYAGLCVSGEARLLKTSSRALSDELERQVLPDGGHASRNPSAIIEALLDLLPLRQAFTARNVPPPQALIGAIDRMIPMLRFFRHPDGEFAQFNGAGPTPTDCIASILAYDDARGSPPDDASHSGYQRVVESDSVLIADAGAPPPRRLSHEAHAGCLSFEFSVGRERLVINCGAPRFGRDDWATAARATAAHSTATIGNVSSCRFATGRAAMLIGEPILWGPKSTPVKRDVTETNTCLLASHDGYESRFGVIHERSLTLSVDGKKLEGEDVFRRRSTPRGKTAEDPGIAIRFHLHPSVRASGRQDGEGVLLALPGGAGWSFSAPGFAVALEESVFLSGSHGPRRTEQIVVRAPLAAAPTIAWSFESVEKEAQPRTRRLPPAATLFGAPTKDDGKPGGS